jgi:hypothetical protein
MINKTRLVVLILLLSLISFVPAQAAEDENEGIAQVVLITPKAGHEQSLVDAITDYHHWIASKAGHSKYQWYEILTGPDTGKYIARSGNHNWSDFDAEHDWDEEAGLQFVTNVAPHIDGIQRSITRNMDDLSNWPEDMTGYTHYQVEQWYVQNGQNGAFRRGLKKIVDTLKAGNFPNYWGFVSVESGGHGNQISLVSANKGWSDMTESDPSFFDLMSKELGGEEEFGKFMSQWGATFKMGKNQMVRFMPKASDYGDK